MQLFAVVENWQYILPFLLELSTGNRHLEVTTLQKTDSVTWYPQYGKIGLGVMVLSTDLETFIICIHLQLRNTLRQEHGLSKSYRGTLQPERTFFVRHESNYSWKNLQLRPKLQKGKGINVDKKIQFKVQGDKQKLLIAMIFKKVFVIATFRLLSI